MKKKRKERKRKGKKGKEKEKKGKERESEDAAKVWSAGNQAQLSRGGIKALKIEGNRGGIERNGGGRGAHGTGGGERKRSGR